MADNMMKLMREILSVAGDIAPVVENRKLLSSLHHTTKDLLEVKVETGLFHDFEDIVLVAKKFQEDLSEMDYWQLQVRKQRIADLRLEIIEEKLRKEMGVCGNLFIPRTVYGSNVMKELEGFDFSMRLMKSNHGDWKSTLKVIRSSSILGWSYWRVWMNLQNGLAGYPDFEDVLYVFGRKLAHLASKGIEIPVELKEDIIW